MATTLVRSTDSHVPLSLSDGEPWRDIDRDDSTSTLYPLGLEAFPTAASPSLPEELSLSSSPLPPPLRSHQIILNSIDSDSWVGKISFSERKGCYEGKTQTFLYIDEVNKSDDLTHILKVSLVEQVVKESFAKDFCGRVQLFVIGNSHLFYLSCGFLPEKVEYKYPDCVKVTRVLKCFFEEKSLEEHSSTVQSALICAKQILATERNKKKKQVDISFIKEHWYWNENYPLRPIANYTHLAEQVHEARNSPRASTLPPIPMYLPEGSRAIWKRIIETPMENQKKRSRLIQKLKVSIVEKPS